MKVCVNLEIMSFFDNMSKSEKQIGGRLSRHVTALTGTDNANEVRFQALSNDGA